MFEVGHQRILRFLLLCALCSPVLTTPIMIMSPSALTELEAEKRRLSPEKWAEKADKTTFFDDDLSRARKDYDEALSADTKAHHKLEDTKREMHKAEMQLKRADYEKHIKSRVFNKNQQNLYKSETHSKQVEAESKRYNARVHSAHQTESKAYGNMNAARSHQREVERTARREAKDAAVLNDVNFFLKGRQYHTLSASYNASLFKQKTESRRVELEKDFRKTDQMIKNTKNSILKLQSELQATRLEDRDLENRKRNLAKELVQLGHPGENVEVIHESTLPPPQQKEVDTARAELFESESIESLAKRSVIESENIQRQFKPKIEEAKNELEKWNTLTNKSRNKMSASIRKEKALMKKVKHLEDDIKGQKSQLLVLDQEVSLTKEQKEQAEDFIAKRDEARLQTQREKEEEAKARAEVDSFLKKFKRSHSKFNRHY